MDLSIDQLLSQLQTTQQAKSSSRLSERNVIELVNKLKALGVIPQGELLHTINGKEFITQARLKTEIQLALQQAGGRLSLTELPALLGVDLVHCERQATVLVQEGVNGVIEAQGELMTPAFFDGMASEIDELLQEAGQMDIGDLAVQYSLGTELLLSVLQARIGTRIKGRLEGGLLYTPAYLRCVKAQLRGALRGVAAPAQLPSIAKELGMDSGGSGPGGLAATLVEELLTEGGVCGTLKGGGVNWTPAIYAQVQTDAVAAFYNQNSWVAYDHVRRLGVSDAKSHLRAAFPQGHALDSAFVSPSLLLSLEGAVDDAIAGGSWVDVAPLLPSVLSVADVRALLAKVPALASGGGGSDALSPGAGGSIGGGEQAGSAVVVGGTCVVSWQLIKALQEKAEADARAAASKAVLERKASSSAVSTSQPAAAPSASKGGKKGAAAAAAADDDDDDDWSMGGKKGGKGGKKGAAGKAAKSGKGAATMLSKGGKDAAPGAGPGCPITLEHIASQLQTWRPDLELDGSGEGEEVAQELARLLLPAAVAAYEQALAAAFTAGAEERRRAKEALSKAFEDAYGRLVLYSRGAELFGGDEANKATLNKHALRITGTECVDYLYKWAAVEYCQAGEVSGGPLASLMRDVSELARPIAPQLNPQERTAISRQTPHDVQAALAAAADTTAAATVEEAEPALAAAAGDVGVRVRRLAGDKKAEKAAATTLRERLLGQLAVTDDPAAALTLLVPLVSLKSAGKALLLPGKVIGAALAALRSCATPPPEALLGSLAEYHSLVVQYLKALSGGGGERSSAELLEDLQGRLVALKAAVGFGDASSSSAPLIAAPSSAGVSASAQDS